MLTFVLILVNDLPVNTAISAFALAFDTFVLILTASKTVRHVQEMRQFQRDHSIAELLLHDGRLTF